jgi:hypothetical protein
MIGSAACNGLQFISRTVMIGRSLPGDCSMDFEWKVVNAEIFNDAHTLLNQLDQQRFEVISTNSFVHEGKAYLNIVARNTSRKAT